MNYITLKKYATRYFPGIECEKAFSTSSRKLISRISLALILISLGLIVVSNESINVYISIIRGVLYMSIATFFKFTLLEFFYRSYYFKDSIESERIEGIDFLTAEALFDVQEDLTKSWASTNAGKYALWRVGVSFTDTNGFLSKRLEKVVPDNFSIPQNSFVTFKDYSENLYDIDKEFADFLFTFGITKKEFVGAVSWVERSEREHKLKKRFWSKAHMDRIPSLGRDWSYGKAFHLEKYAYDLLEEPGFQGLAEKGLLLMHELSNLEHVLVRHEEANALIISEDSMTALAIVVAFNEHLTKGLVPAILEHKRLYVLNPQRIADRYPDKASFENELIIVFNEVINAGNILLVLEDFAGFVELAHKIGSDAVEILQKYLGSASVQIIALSDFSRFHSTIEPNVSLMSHFDVIQIEEKDEEAIVPIIEIKAEAIESEYDIFFTYQAVKEAASSASRYFAGEPLEKAIDILLEIPVHMKETQKVLVTKEDVLAVLAVKTGIPMGSVGKEEQQKLSQLENELHKRVIGQNVAVAAVSEAMRRARAGVANPKRPMSSFLFLGPTGVGKTETAKALAEVFFGGEEDIIRLDMSEFKTEDAMERLIGSFEAGKAGVLSSRLREKPYGVLLLDEFEKTSKDVIDLFLQVLDEGFFSDMMGKRVNARNLIIIATSNACSEKIVEALKDGVLSAEEKQSIMDTIISQGIFKAELLNRFDGVIMFEPLDHTALQEVGRLQLKKFAKRLEEKGIRLAISDDLVDFISEIGAHTIFGGRAMNRAIQDTVETLVARALLDGKIKSGSNISIVRNKDADYALNPLSITLQ